MFIENSVYVCDIILAISDAIDLASQTLSDHHKKVSYLACNIATEMNLPDDEVKNIALAAILHDIGAFSLEERNLIQSLKLAKVIWRTMPNRDISCLKTLSH